MGILTLLTTLPLTGYAEVPQQINYQEYLTDSEGTPLDTTTVPFSTCDMDARGTALWSETRRVTITEGVSVASDKEIDKSECTSIYEIWEDASAYKDHWVTVSGEYQGWRGKGIQHPMITRSDWVIRDHTGGIYISGKSPCLDPVKGIGIIITVKGVVKVSKNGVTYIRAQEVILNGPN